MALADEHDVFRSVFANSPDSMSVAINDRFVEVNPSFERIFGWTRDEAIGQSGIDLGLWIDPTPRAALLAECKARGIAGPLDMTARHRDGTPIDGVLLVRQFPVAGTDAVLFLFRNTSPEKKAIADLAMSEARLRGFAEAAFEGIGLSDRGRLIDCNDQLACMLGYHRDELLNQPVQMLVAPESVEVVRAAMAANRQDAYEHVALRKDGSRVSVEVRARMVEVNGKSIRVTVIRDVTERKRAEAEERRLIDELRTRNAEMEQFVYTVSHDLKSPLVTIKGFLGTIFDDLAHGRSQHLEPDLKRIAAAAERMMALLEDLLELSRAGRASISAARVPLGEVVAEALEVVDGRLKSHRCVVEVAPELPVVAGDRRRLVQVIQNLVENAAKYMGPQSAPQVDISGAVDGDHAHLRIRDNGMGIDPRHAERVFGLFEKLDPRSEGTGVGLALVRRVVEAHGGRVWVESEGSGRGSTFVVALPRWNPATVDGRG